MKKRLLISAVCIVAIAGVAYASSSHNCGGTSKLVANLNLDDARAYEVEQILNSYKEVKELAKSGRYDDIPAFIEEQNALLSQVLTDEEFQQFKDNVKDSMKGMDFSKYKKYAEKGHDYEG